MHVISNRPLRNFALNYPEAGTPLQAWRRHMQSRNFESFAELRAAFASVDLVGKLSVFDIRGNHYRLIASIDFARQICYVKDVLTHSQYDGGNWMKHCTVKEGSLTGWGQFEHASTIRPLFTELDHDLALSAADRMVASGAMHDPTHPQYEAFGLLFDVIYDYEQVHCPF